MALETVYAVVTDHLPGLIEHLGVLVRELERDVGWTGDDSSNE